MAWPKLRYRKNTGPLIIISERNTLGRENAPGHVRSSGPADSGPVAHVTPDPAGHGVTSPGDDSGPVPWPVPGPRRAMSEPEPLDIWDWAPAQPGADTGADADVAGPRQPAELPAGVQGAGEPIGAPRPTEDPVPRAEGIGYRFSSLGHIFGHSRMGMWPRRLLFAVVIFTLCTILLDWKVGLTLAVLAVIADTILRARTVTPRTVTGARKPTKPQRMTAKQLAALEKAGYRALHSRLIPDSDEHIDHLVIGPAGVFAIDSEWWDKHLPIRTKNARQLWLGPFSMKERLEHARWEADQASALISAPAGVQVAVRPVMAVYGPKIPWDVTTIRDVDVFSSKRLRTYLRRYARQNNARPLEPAEVDRIFRAAHAAFPHLDPGVPAPELPAE